VDKISIETRIKLGQEFVSPSPIQQILLLPATPQLITAPPP